jgi:hypothetical protein
MLWAANLQQDLFARRHFGVDCVEVAVVAEAGGLALRSGSRWGTVDGVGVDMGAKWVVQVCD